MSAAGAFALLRATAGNIADRGEIQPGDIGALRAAVVACRIIRWGTWRGRLAMWLLKGL